MRNSDAKQKLKELTANVKLLMSVEQPSTKEIGQVWQIIPKNKYQEPKLGVIIKKGLIFDTLVILKSIFDSESIEGNDLCLFESDTTALKTPVLAVYWKPFSMIPLMKSSYGKYLCSLSMKQVEQIIKAKSSNQYPQTLEGEMFRAECNYQTEYLGFNEIKGLDIDLTSVANDFLEKLQTSFVQPDVMFAAPNDEDRFFKFKNRLLDKLTDEANDFAQTIYKDCKTISRTEFSIDLEKDVCLIFFDKNCKPIDYKESQNKSLSFKLDSINQSIFDYTFIGLEEKPKLNE